MQNITVVDLFCGAGGLSLGFAKAGFRIVRAFDKSEAAVETYSGNVGDCAILTDLSRPELDVPEATVAIGGPPCQGFSSAGLRRANDKRNSLVACFAQIVAKARPKAFVFENVEGFLTADGGARVLELLGPLLGVGYRIHVRKVNAANYGVPQHRKRVIGIGGLGWDPTFPEHTHTAFGAPGALLASRHLPLTPTVEEALAGLPAPSTGPPGRPQGHFCAPLMGVELERARHLKPGQTMRDLPGSLQHGSYLRRAYRRVMDGTPSERRGGAPAGVRRLRPDQPSKAVTGGATSEFLHPYEHRTLTLREAARLQTFPDSFLFSGTQSDEAQLIGDAVPPLFALAIASQLARDLREAKPTQNDGALLSFVPTLSDGCSPALKQVIGLVQNTFPLHLEGRESLLWP
jgi:DNA (cytosine-5)-methyltransferase 1